MFPSRNVESSVAETLGFAGHLRYSFDTTPYSAVTFDIGSVPRRVSVDVHFVLKASSSE